jgi:hypothetical protein
MALAVALYRYFLFPLVFGGVGWHLLREKLPLCYGLTS